MEQIDVESLKENGEDQDENENIHDWEQADAEKETNLSENVARLSDAVEYNFQQYYFMASCCLLLI